MSNAKPLNIGLIGYGFMGRTHSNAYRQAPKFFDLEYEPVLKACCARNEDKIKDFAENWGYESYETDWKKLIDGTTSMPSIFARRTICTRKSPSRPPRRAR